VEDWEGGGEEPRLGVGEVDLGGLERVRREMPLVGRRDVVDVVEK